MSLNIKDPETDRLVRVLAAETGETITAAVANAVRERLDRVRGSRRAPDLTGDIRALVERVAGLPELDRRAPDVILGYDSHGLPG